MCSSDLLCAGIPALVSDAAGSRDLVAASRAGAVFACGDIARLTAELRRRLDDPSLVAREKRLAREYAPRAAPAAVGAYLADVFRHAFLGEGARPSAPWLTPPSS